MSTVFVTADRPWRVYVSRGVMHMELAELPVGLDDIAQTVGVLVHQGALEGIRVLIDCTAIPPVQEPPPIAYLERLADVLYPLTLVAHEARCALVVRGESFTWRARFLVSKVSGGTMQWRVFSDAAAALAWLGPDAQPPVLQGS